MEFSKWETETLGGRQRGAECGGELLEGVLPLEMRDALHAPAPIVCIPGDDVDVDVKDLLPRRLAAVDAQVEAVRPQGRLDQI